MAVFNHHILFFTPKMSKHFSRHFLAKTIDNVWSGHEGHIEQHAETFDKSNETIGRSFMNS